MHFGVFSYLTWVFISQIKSSKNLLCIAISVFIVLALARGLISRGHSHAL